MFNFNNNFKVMVAGFAGPEIVVTKTFLQREKESLISLLYYYVFVREEKRDLWRGEELSLVVFYVNTVLRCVQRVKGHFCF